jgi:uncharacterized protein (DUF362 family)
MNKRIRKSLFWSLAIVLAGVLVLWDMHRRPPEVEEGKVFTVLKPSALTGEGGTVVCIVRSDFPELADPVAPTSELTYGQVEQMVRKAVALGELERMIHKAEAERSDASLWVVIKPNIVELKKRGSGVITDWRVVKAIITVVHEIAPKARITIAEGGAWIPPERTDVREQIPWGRIGDGFEIAGYRQLLEDDELSGIRLDIVDLNFDEPVETPVPGKWHARETYFIPKTILDCDVLIDVPVLKITGTAGMTVAMKNFVGIAPGMVYGWAKMRGYPPGSGNPGIPHSDAILDETIVDLTSLSGVDFCVVDAIVAMERAKTDEDGGRPVRMNTIVAGADVVAVDAVCARLMGMNPDDIEHVTLGHAKGLGIGRLSDIRVVGQRIGEVARRFEKFPADWGSSGEYAHYGQGNRIWLLKGPIPLKDREKACPDPNKLYPTPDQDGWCAPVYFHDDRIDLDRYYSDPTNCVAYAYAEFDAPETEEAHLWVGSDEGMQVWINGKRVYRFEGARRHRLPNERVPIPIRKGRNTCLVEATQTRGRYDFSLKVCEPETDPRYDGNTVFGLKYYVPKTAVSQTKELAAVDERPRRGEWYEEHYVDLTQPGRVKLSAFLPGEAEASWIGLDAPLMWGKKMALQAQIRGRRIEIRTENARRFHLKMEGPLAKALRSLKVDVDGFVVRVKKTTPGDWIGMEANLGENGKVKGWSAKKRREAPKDQTVLGTTPATLTREGLDSPLGNWFTDAIRWATGADVAFQNNGGIRKDLEKGPVTVGDIFEMNFPDELYTFEVTGKELLAILEHNVRDERERPMQVSGLRYTFDRSRPEGTRILRATVDPDKVYTVGGEDFLCHRGERFFGKKVDFVNTGIHIVDAQIRYARQMGRIEAKSEGRIEESGVAR